MLCMIWNIYPLVPWSEVSRGGLPISSRKTLPVELLSPSVGELSVLFHHNTTTTATVTATATKMATSAATVTATDSNSNGIQAEILFASICQTEMTQWLSLCRVTAKHTKCPLKGADDVRLLRPWSRHEAMKLSVSHSSIRRAYSARLGEAFFDGITHHGGLQLPLQNAFRASTPPKMEYPRSPNSAPPKCHQNIAPAGNCDLFILSLPSFFFPFPILQFPFLAFAFNDVLFWSYLFVVPFCDALSFAFSSRYFLWFFISFLCLSFLQLFFSFRFLLFPSSVTLPFLLPGFFAVLCFRHPAHRKSPN